MLESPYYQVSLGPTPVLLVRSVRVPNQLEIILDEIIVLTVGQLESLSYFYFYSHRCLLSDKIYAVGGFDRAYLNSVECFEPRVSVGCGGFTANWDVYSECTTDINSQINALES